MPRSSTRSAASTAPRSSPIRHRGCKPRPRSASTRNRVHRLPRLQLRPIASSRQIATLASTTVAASASTSPRRPPSSRSRALPRPAGPDAGRLIDGRAALLARRPRPRHHAAGRRLACERSRTPAQDVSHVSLALEARDLRDRDPRRLRHRRTQSVHPAAARRPARLAAQAAGDIGVGPQGRLPPRARDRSCRAGTQPNRFAHRPRARRARRSTDYRHGRQHAGRRHRAHRRRAAARRGRARAARPRCDRVAAGVHRGATGSRREGSARRHDRAATDRGRADCPTGGGGRPEPRDRAPAHRRARGRRADHPASRRQPHPGATARRAGLRRDSEDA